MASEAGELRLAVVMNGGVSLAVWMGGGAHELDLLRRASARNTEARNTEAGNTEAASKDTDADDPAPADPAPADPAPAHTPSAAVPEYDRAAFDGWRRAVREKAVGSVVIDVI